MQKMHQLNQSSKNKTEGPLSVMFITPEKVPSHYQGNSWDGSIPGVKDKKY